MRFYEYDRQRVFTGNTMDPDPKTPIPKRWTHVPPPEGPGVHIFDGVKWFTRDQRPTPPPRPQRAPQVTVGEFFDLFGDQKYAILASDNPEVRALIQDITVRDKVNLNHPHLAQGLQMLVDAGFAIDVERILAGQMPEEDEA